MRADEVDCFCIGGKRGPEEEARGSDRLRIWSGHCREGGTMPIFCFKMMETTYDWGALLFVRFINNLPQTTLRYARGRAHFYEVPRFDVEVLAKRFKSRHLTSRDNSLPSGSLVMLQASMPYSSW
jgi:hypothetical protein